MPIYSPLQRQKGNLSLQAKDHQQGIRELCLEHYQLRTLKAKILKTKTQVYSQMGEREKGEKPASFSVSVNMAVKLQSFIWKILHFYTLKHIKQLSQEGQLERTQVWVSNGAEFTSSSPSLPRCVTFGVLQRLQLQNKVRTIYSARLYG